MDISGKNATQPNCIDLKKSKSAFFLQFRKSLQI